MRRLRASLTDFVVLHGRSADAVIEPIGRPGARVIVVGADGAWGDGLAPSVSLASRACTGVPGLTAHDELPRQAGARLRTGLYEWQRMAGISLGTPRDRRAAHARSRPNRTQA